MVAKRCWTHADNDDRCCTVHTERIAHGAHHTQQAFLSAASRSCATPSQTCPEWPLLARRMNAAYTGRSGRVHLSAPVAGTGRLVIIRADQTQMLPPPLALRKQPCCSILRRGFQRCVLMAGPHHLGDASRLRLQLVWCEVCAPTGGCWAGVHHHGIRRTSSRWRRC